MAALSPPMGLWGLAGAGAGAAIGGGVTPAAPVRGSSTDPQLVFLYSAPLLSDAGVDAAPIPKLDVDMEMLELREAIELAERRIRLYCGVATTDNLRARTTLGCRALHYTGHGMESGLAFEEETGLMHNLKPDQLRHLVAAGGGTAGVQFVFVSACYSQSAGEAFVSAGVPHVVACRWDSTVSDGASRTFARNFYLALLVGKTVQNAFEIGQAAVAVMPEFHGRPAAAGNNNFLLLPAGANHDVAVFADAVAGQFIDETPLPLTNRCSVPPRFFEGRYREMHQAIKYLLRESQRVVSLVGLFGAGKTAVAFAISQWISERRPRKFSDGIYFAQLERGLSHDLKQVIGNALGCPMDTSVSDWFRQLRDRRFLFVVDGITEENERPISEILSELLAVTSKCSLLLTTDVSLAVSGRAAISAKDVPITALSPAHAVALFIALVKRPLKLGEMGATANSEAPRAFEANPIIQQLQGWPLRIVKAATLVTNGVPLDARLLDKVPPVPGVPPVAFTKALDTNNVPPAVGAPTRVNSMPFMEAKDAVAEKNEIVNQLVNQLQSADVVAQLHDTYASSIWVALGADFVTWPQLLDELERHLAGRIPLTESSRGPSWDPSRPTIRGLSPHDRAFLRTVFMAYNEGQDPLSSTISISQFGKFWTWLGPAFAQITRIHNIWMSTSPMLFHGFLDTGTATAMLTSTEAYHGVGTFLLRFSVRHPGCMALSFVEEVIVPAADAMSTPRRIPQVSHVLMKPTKLEDGSSWYKVLFAGSGEELFSSIPQFLSSCEPLRYLYPAIRKESVEAFRHRSFASAVPFDAPDESDLNPSAGPIDVVPPPRRPLVVDGNPIPSPMTRGMNPGDM